MNVSGKVLAIILPSDSEDPNEEQIRDGFNSVNEAVTEGHYASSVANYETPVTLSFSNLDENTDYLVWFSGENDVSRQPEVMPDYNLKRMELKGKSEVTREEVRYTFDFSALLAVSLLALYL
jgi:hypothetical protein